MSDESIYSFAVLRNRLVVTGDLVALTALRIGAGRASDPIGNDLPVLRDALGAPFVPGASLKGAFRARLEALIRAVAPAEALDLPEIEAWQALKIAPLKEDADLVDDRMLSEAIWKNSTLIDLTFGAPWIASRLFFRDALVNRALWFDQFEVRNGVALNRDTETVEQGLLYDYEVVPAGTTFTFELVLENAADWQLGMVLLALRPWEQGDAQIGGFRSRGLGHVKLENVQHEYIEIRERNADDVLRMLGYDPDAAVGKIDQAQTMRWYDAFRAVLRNPALARERAGNA